MSRSGRRLRTEGQATIAQYGPIWPQLESTPGGDLSLLQSLTSWPTELSQPLEQSRRCGRDAMGIEPAPFPGEGRCKGIHSLPEQ